MQRCCSRTSSDSWMADKKCQLSLGRCARVGRVISRTRTEAEPRVGHSVLNKQERMSAATIITDVARLLVQPRRRVDLGRQAEQLAGRSRSRLPPFGRRYAKPPAAALLTGQVARELASTLERLRLVRSFLAMALAGRLLHRSSSRCCGGGAGSLLSQTGWGSVSWFRARLYEAWAVTSPAGTRRFSISSLRPRRSDRCQDWDPALR